MYQEFYNFSAEPFRLSPDHGFAYSHRGYAKARAYMDYAFMRAEGFVMITGRPGTGKTTLIGALLDELATTSASIANLVCTQLQADDLLKLVAYDFGIPVLVVEKGELLQRLTQQLQAWHRDGRRALLIVDEAQDLSVSAMEELRLLTNIQVDSQPLLQIFLLGQPELRELILSPRLEQVHQRIIAASHLRPLESDETEAYIRHRLEAVNWRGNPAISKTVYPLIYKFSEGIPRRINLIFSRLLLHCAVEQRHRISVADVREVVGELQDENLASGDSFAESDFQVPDVFDKDTFSDNDTDNQSIAGSQDKNDVAEAPEHKSASPSRKIVKISPGSASKNVHENRVTPATCQADNDQRQEAVSRTALMNASQSAQGLEVMRPAAENTSLKSVNSRHQKSPPHASEIKVKDAGARRGKRKNLPSQIAQDEQEANNEGDAVPDNQIRDGLSVWSKLTILVLTFFLITYGSPSL